MPKKKELQQIHGKEETFQPTTLDQVWGDDGVAKYKTLDMEEYKQAIGEMSKADLQSHATKMGIIPTDNREGLQKKLVREFCSHVAGFKRPVHVDANRPIAPSAEALKIMSEGR